MVFETTCSELDNVQSHILRIKCYVAICGAIAIGYLRHKSMAVFGLITSDRKEWKTINFGAGGVEIR